MLQGLLLFAEDDTFAARIGPATQPVTIYQNALQSGIQIPDIYLVAQGFECGAERFGSRSRFQIIRAEPVDSSARLSATLMSAAVYRAPHGLQSGSRFHGS